ncbi:B-cell antigen receptor complex-associated protein beta chain [Pholidichthys leucotaenia]
MRWILAGCCLLVLISLSVAVSRSLQISQKPRFYGVKTARSVVIYCLSSLQHFNSSARWFKADRYDTPSEYRTEILELDESVNFHHKNKIQNAFMYLVNLQIYDSGVYFCKINSTWGPGTELQVARSIDRAQATYRSKMKDGLIILQGLLLAACVAALLLRKHKLEEKKDSMYEEPERDHIYEGLGIESCAGGLYEELAVYSQAEGAEAPWE